MHAAITRPTRPSTRVRAYPVGHACAVRFLTVTSRIVRSAISATAALALAATGVLAGSSAAQADADVKPRKSACTADPSDYACLKTSDRREVAGEPVTFTGSLSKEARRQLSNWTKGENTICLTRYNKKPLKDGSWPWETLDNVCTTLNTDGTFGMVAYLGKQGLHYYGVEMGPCRADKDLCGGGDPGLIGVGNTKKDRVVAVRTVAP